MAKPPAVQPDLYLQIGDGDLRDLMLILEFPFFGLGAHPTMAVREFVSADGGTYIRCSPGARGGATQWDHDILIYCISMLYRMNAERRRNLLSKNETLRLNNSTGTYEIDTGSTSLANLLDEAEKNSEGDAKLSFVAHDLLKLLRRQTGQRAYKQLKESLFRLRSTTIETNIGPDTRRNQGFGWISKYEFVEERLGDGSARMKHIDVWITPWVIQALTAANSVLQLNPAYFELDSGLEKRLYQIARKHCGKQASFSISLGKLAAKTGTTQPINKFKADLVKVLDDDNIPDYKIVIEEPPALPGRKRTPLDRVLVVFTPRKEPHIGNRVLKKAARQAEKAGNAQADDRSFFIEESDDDRRS